PQPETVLPREPPPEPVPEPPPSGPAASEADAPRADWPEIPPEYRGRLVAEDLSGAAGGPYLAYRHAYLRNYTNWTGDELQKILKTPMAMKLGSEPAQQPQVLIYHTHATESYCPYDSDLYDKRYNWRSTDNNTNMVAVGALLAQTLREQGIATLQDTSQHDYPSYDGSYQNSHDAIRRYLARYPSIRVVLDVHRDAIEREGAVVIKPTVELDGEKYAQLMIIANVDDGSGLIPKWRENFRFAAALADELERSHRGLTRPVMVAYRRYNQQLSTGGLLLEFGSHGSTLEESKRTARLVGEGLARLLKNTVS
ncbi:MAG: stage II sporulation protein P, partial [Oscillospiraceae bacterium]